MHKAVLIILICASFCIGCAIKPIPENATGVSTVAIVARVRCEAQTAVQAAIVKRLRIDGDLDSLRRADLIEQNPRNVELLKNYKILPLIQQRVFSQFDDAVAVFDFQLRMTETNNFGGGATLVRPFTAGLDVFGLRLADNKERENFRTFRITVNVVDLMFEPCEGTPPQVSNFEYPITGKIGLIETFDTYFTLAFTNRFGTLKDWEGQSPFVDTIKFTTAVVADFNAGYSVVPSGRGYTFRDASSALGVSRRDEHQLIVGLSIPAANKFYGGFASNRDLVNSAVDRAITKQRLFNLNPLNPYGPLNE